MRIRTKSTAKGRGEFIARQKARKEGLLPEQNIKTSEIKEKKPLFLIMQEYWFNEIEQGRKDIEYREDSQFYRSRLINKNGEYRNYSHVVMQVGYNAGARRMTVEIEKIVLDGEFQIYLGEITDRNF